MVRCYLSGLIIQPSALCDGEEQQVPAPLNANRIGAPKAKVKPLNAATGGLAKGTLYPAFPYWYSQLDHDMGI